MPDQASKKDSAKVLAPDPHKLGLVAAAFFATLVMALCLYRHVTLGEALYRAGLTFIVSYAAAFVFVLVVVRAALTELVKQREERKRQIREKMAKEAAAKEAAEKKARLGETP